MPAVYAHVWVCIHAICPLQGHPLQTHIRCSKNAPLCMPTSGPLHTLPYICPLQGHPSPNAKMWFSKMPMCMPISGSLHASIHMPTAKDTPSKRTYVVLKNASLCMPISGSLYMFPYICPLQGQPSPNERTWLTKMPRCVCPCLGLYTRFHSYAQCKDTPTQMHIRGSQKCPHVYAHARVSYMVPYICPLQGHLSPNAQTF